MKTHKTTNLFLTILSILFAGSFVLAQSDKADILFTNQEWQEASSAYKDYLKLNKNDSLAWYRLGIAQLNSMQYSKAISSFGTARDHGFNSNAVAYGLAQAYVLNKENTKAINELAQAAESGLRFYGRMKQDTVFSDLENDPQYTEILQKVKLNAYPCLTMDIYRHFDFWLGEWDVLVNGNKVGDNSITMAEGGCALHEDYTTYGNYSGQSINYYDPQDAKWHQIWVDNTRVVLDYVEIQKAEGMLKFQCDYLSPLGQKVYSRLTFTENEDGTVRQLFESSSDGEDWNPSFDGLYVKKR